MGQSWEARVAALEREVRAFRLAAVGLLIISGCAFLVGARSEETPKAIKAASLQIVDESGTPRVVLTAINGSPQVSLVGSGERRLLLAVDSRPHISLFDDRNKTAAHVTLMKQYSTLSLDSRNGSLVLNTFDDGEPSLVLTDKNGKTVWHAGGLQK